MMWWKPWAAIPCTVSFAVFAYLAGLKLGQTPPAICCGCDISLELPMAAVSSPGCYEMPGGAADPNLTLANHGCGDEWRSLCTGDTAGTGREQILEVWPGLTGWDCCVHLSKAVPALQHGFGWDGFHIFPTERQQKAFLWKQTGWGQG